MIKLVLLILILFSFATVAQEGPSVKTGSHMGFSYQFNADLKDAFDLNSIEVVYSKLLSTLWLESFFSQTSGSYQALARHNPALGDESETLKNYSESLTIFGVGVAYRGHFIQKLAKSEKVFEVTSASLGYYSFNEGFRNETYSGPGLKAALSIQYRTSPEHYYGIKMSYHMANVVKKATMEGQSHSDRSLILTWLSAGIDIGFYF